MSKVILTLRSHYVSVNATKAYPLSQWGPIVAVLDSQSPSQFDSLESFLEYVAEHPVVVVEGLHRLTVLYELLQDGKLAFREVPCQFLRSDTDPRVLRKIGASFNAGHDLAVRTTLGERLQMALQAMADMKITRDLLLQEQSSSSRRATLFNKIVDEVHAELGRDNDQIQSTKNELQPLYLSPEVLSLVIKEYNNTAEIDPGSPVFAVKSKSRLFTAHLTVPSTGPFYWLSKISDSLCISLVKDLCSQAELNKEKRELVYLKHVFRGWLLQNLLKAMEVALGGRRTKAFQQAISGWDKMLAVVQTGAFDPAEPLAYKQALTHLIADEAADAAGDKPAKRRRVSAAVRIQGALEVELTSCVVAFLESAIDHGCFDKVRASTLVKFTPWKPLFVGKELGQLFEKETKTLVYSLDEHLPEEPPKSSSPEPADRDPEEAKEYFEDEWTNPPEGYSPTKVLDQVILVNDGVTYNVGHYTHNCRFLQRVFQRAYSSERDAMVDRPTVRHF